MKAPRLSGMTAVLLAASLCGCSLGLFSDGKDPSVLAQKPAHEAGAGCGQVDLGGFDPRSGLDVSSFRTLVDCLDSNGASQPLAGLVGALSDEDLLPVVRAFHEFFLRDPIRLHQFASTYEQWKSGDTDLSAVAALVGTVSGVVAATPPSPELASVLKVILGGIAPEEVEGGLDALLAVVRSPAWQSLVARLGASRGDFAKAIHRYLKAQRTPGGVELDLRLLQAMASGRLFEAVDHFSLSAAPGRDIRHRTAAIASLLHELLAPGGGIVLREQAAGFRSLLAVSRAAHVPVSCLLSGEGDGRGEPQDEPQDEPTTVQDLLRFVLSELSRQSSAGQSLKGGMAAYLGRGLPIQAALSGSFCSLPPELLQAYTDFRGHLASEHAPAGAHLLAGFEQAGLGALAADALGGGAAGPSPLIELIPVLVELDARGALEDLILLAGSIRVEERRAWQRLARAWVSPRPELLGLSLHEAFYDALVRSGSRGIEAVLETIAASLRRPEPVLAPALSSLRRLARLNDVHPFVTGLRGIGATPGLAEGLLRSFSLVMQRKPAEFGELLEQWLGTGRVTGMIESALRIFRRQVERGAVSGPIRQRPVPEFDDALLRFHSFSRQDVIQIGETAKPAPGLATQEWRGCSLLDPGIHLERHRSFGYGARLQAFLDCVASGTGEPPLEAAVLLGAKLPSGRSIVGAVIEGFGALKLSPGGARELLDFFGSGGAVAAGSLRTLVPLFAGTSPEARPILARLETLAGKQLESEHFTGAMARIRKLLEEPVPDAWSDEERFGLDRFAGVLGTYECIADSEDLSRRAAELVEDYRHSVTSIDPPAAGWDPSTLSGRMKPVLAALAPGGGLAPALAAFLRRFAGREAELAEWLARSSNDWRVIPYFHPGEDRPRAKIINSLDAFELLATNADFDFMLSGNYATRFNTLIALAWGDEPRQNRPAAVRGLQPKTLEEASREILATLRLSEKYIGYPGFPNCARGGEPASGFSLFPLEMKARVFNMRQLAPVLEDMRGLRVLRELLVELHQPGGVAGAKSLVPISPALARIGGFRLLSRIFRLAALSGSINAALGGLVAASQEPGFVELLERLGANGAGAATSIWSFVGKELDPELARLILDWMAALRSPGIVRGVLQQATAMLGSDGTATSLALSGEKLSAMMSLLVDPRLRGVFHALGRAERDPGFEAWVLSLLARQPGGWWLGVELARLADLVDFADRSRPGAGIPPAFWSLLELVSEQNPRAQLGGRELRQYLAEQLLRGKVGAWIEWMATDPAKASRILESVEKSSLPGELLQVMQAASRAFSARPGLTLDAQGLETRAHVHSSN